MALIDDVGLSPKPELELQDDIGLVSPAKSKTAAPLTTRFEELREAAGPRGFTFAGRLVTDPKETPEQALSRIPLGELEAGSLAATGQLDLAAGLALGKGAAALATSPVATTRTVIDSIGRIPQAYRNTVQSLGEAIVNRMPKNLRAGRGTPLEFREARALMEAEAANAIDQAVSLGSLLKQNLSVGERLRADQILRGGITTSKTPQKITDAVKPVRQEIDRIQKELVRMGRISPETVQRFEDNFGPYLARLYASKEFSPTKAVVPFGHPTRAGTPRLQMRGERVDVEIPLIENEMDAVARLLGPEKDFRRAFREEARRLAKRKETITSERIKEQQVSQERTSRTETHTTGGEGEFTEVPLSGVAQRLEKIVTDALQTRGMTAGEAAAAVGRVKAAAVKAAEGGPEVKITGGGTTTQRTTETIKERVIQERETVRTVIENLGINRAQKAALHAYYDAISRAGAKAKRVKVGDRTFRIEPIMDPESGVERMQALKPLLDAGYAVEGREGNKVKLFRDLPEGTRRAMGEIRDQPGFVAAKTIAQAGREAAVVKYFKTIADNPEWTSAVEKPGYRLMPDDKKRLADLAGKFVRSDIAAELDSAMRIKGDAEKIVNRITQLWKIGKVTNPATITRNFMSSGMIAEWGGLSAYKPSGARSYTKAMMGFIGKDPEGATLLTEARQGGLFHAGYNQQEINLLAEGFVASREENPLIRTLDAVKHLIDKSGAGRVYGSVDEFFKGALYVHGRRELGLSPQLAMRYAKKYGIDYSDISPAVRFMREMPLGTPFVTFASKAIPLAIETAAKHPVRFFKWPAIFLGVNELSKAQFPGEGQDIERVKEMGELSLPRYVQLPTKGEDGRYQFLDLGYILPFGDLLEVFDKMTGEGSASISFEPLGGPLQPVVEAWFNKSLFTNREIYNETDDWPTTVAKISDHVFKGLLPAWAPPIPGTGFRGGYSTEAFRKAFAEEFPPTLPGEEPMAKTDFLGRQRGIMATVASKILGINVKEVALDDLRRLGFLEFQRKSNELSRKLARIARMDLSDHQKEIELERIQEQYEKLVETMREKYGAASTAPTSRRPPAVESRERLNLIDDLTPDKVGPQSMLRDAEKDLSKLMREPHWTLEDRIKMALQNQQIKQEITA